MKYNWYLLHILHKQSGLHFDGGLDSIYFIDSIPEIFSIGRSIFLYSHRFESQAEVLFHSHHIASNDPNPDPESIIARGVIITRIFKNMRIFAGGSSLSHFFA